MQFQVYEGLCGFGRGACCDGHPWPPLAQPLTVTAASLPVMTA